MKVYIQIGANIGDDDFYRKMKNLPERSDIHLIEPCINLHNDLNNCYSDLMDVHNITIHNFGISKISGEHVLNLYSNSGLSSIINRRSYRDTINSIKINCKTFNEFCLDNEITKVEYLSIDTEGLDYEILNSIDLSTIDIIEIVFEEWPYIDDDLNCSNNTGEIFLKNEVIPKYYEYSLSKIILDDMSSFSLIKKI